MANLEYGIPMTPETIFHMASVSKQFTAYSIVLLAKNGKLHLDDDIHKYLSWFPDLKEKITVRNLLNHTSGIRDQWQLLAISGTRLDDVITQEHIIKILSKQLSAVCWKFNFMQFKIRQSKKRRGNIWKLRRKRLYHFQIEMCNLPYRALVYWQLFSQ